MTWTTHHSCLYLPRGKRGLRICVLHLIRDKLLCSYEINACSHHAGSNLLLPVFSTILKAFISVLSACRLSRCTSHGSRSARVHAFWKDRSFYYPASGKGNHLKALSRQQACEWGSVPRSLRLGCKARKQCHRCYHPGLQRQKRCCTQ